MSSPNFPAVQSTHPSPIPQIYLWKICFTFCMNRRTDSVTYRLFLNKGLLPMHIGAKTGSKRKLPLFQSQPGRRQKMPLYSVSLIWGPDKF